MGFLIRLSISLLVAFLVALIIHEQKSHQAALFDEWVWEAGERYGVDPLLVKAVIWRETEFDPTRYGKARERGLMQVTPVAGEEWAKANKIRNFQVNDLFDPRTNIRAGTWYLARALNNWKGRDNPIPFALAEYNAGRTHARRWAVRVDGAENNAEEFIKSITFPTTKAYVEAIMTKHAAYQDRSRERKP